MSSRSSKDSIDEPLIHSQRNLTSKAPFNRHLLNALLLAFAFFGLFVAFNTTQNLESSIVPEKMGYWSLATIYVAFCFSAMFVAAPVTNLLPPKFSLILGGSCYLTLIVANLYPEWGTLIPAAAILGTGAGILWAAQGAYLTAAAGNYAESQNQPTKSAMGLFQGMFFGIFQCGQVVGNIIASIILMYSGSSKDNAIHILFYTFIGIAAVGILLFLFLGKEESEAEKSKSGVSRKGDSTWVINDDGKSGAPRKDLWENVKYTGVQLVRVVMLLRDPKMLLLVPVCVFSGMEQSFVFGDFTSNIIKQTKGSEWIGFVMAVFGVTDALGSVILGRIADRFTKRIFVAVGLIAHTTIFAFYLTFLNIDDDALAHITTNYWILFITAAILGVADSCWNTFPSVMMSVFFTDNAEAAFANLKFFQASGSVCAFVWGPLLAFEYKIIILAVVMCVAVASLVTLDVFVASLDTIEKKKEDETEA